MRRSLATSASSLAGRPRFYREVSIAPTSAPWKQTQTADRSAGPSAVPSPISAGVDGTDSASGVVVRRSRQSPGYYRRWLEPRAPDGTTFEPDEHEARGSPDNPKWFAICLDGRPLQTPGRSRLVVPSEFLAAAIAWEWNAQSPTLRPTQMPLTTLSCTVLDQVCEQPHHYQNSVLRYLPTDNLRLWADPAVDPDLHSEQDRLWRPIHRRLERILGRPFPTTTADANVIIPSARHSNHGNGSAGSRPAGDPSLLQFCQEWVESLDAWHLGILYSLTVEAKSLGLALSYLHSSSQLDGAGDDDGDPIASSLLNGGEASSLRDVWVPACRVEEEVQIAQWGVVEGGHDYDRLNCSIQFHAAALMHMCLEVERQRTTVHPGPGLSTS